MRYLPENFKGSHLKFIISQIMIGVGRMKSQRD